MHHDAAGRITRTLVTFDNMYTCCKNGTAYVCLSKYKTEYIGSAWISAYNGTAYYGSGAERPNVEIPYTAGHFLQWNAMLSSNQWGYKYYEIRWQQYSEQTYDKPSQKEIDIAFYKRGLGGFTTSLFRGEKLLR